MDRKVNLERLEARLRDALSRPLTPQELAKAASDIESHRARQRAEERAETRIFAKGRAPRD